MLNRQHLIKQFLRNNGWGDASISALIPDASSRNYYRLRAGNHSVMLMDDPTGEIGVFPFVKITKHLDSLGIRVPRVNAEDQLNGLLLLDDLGDETFTALLLKNHSENGLYQKAVDVLTQIHTHANRSNIQLEPYDFEHFIEEANLFTQWYLPAVYQKQLSPNQKAQYLSRWKEVYQSLPPLKETIVLRDYHVDNLMLNGGDCAVLDYQDALIGPVAYDLISLLEDARRDISAELFCAMRQRYLNDNPDIDADALDHHLVVWGVQRHCKVAGIFVRLWLRDGKPVYLKHLNRVMGLIAKHINHPFLAPLKSWTDENMDGFEHREFELGRDALARYI